MWENFAGGHQQSTCLVVGKNEWPPQSMLCKLVGQEYLIIFLSFHCPTLCQGPLIDFPQAKRWSLWAHTAQFGTNSRYMDLTIQSRAYMYGILTHLCVRMCALKYVNIQFRNRKLLLMVLPPSHKDCLIRNTGTLKKCIFIKKNSNSYQTIFFRRRKVFQIQ